MTEEEIQREIDKLREEGFVAAGVVADYDRSEFDRQIREEAIRRLKEHG